MLMRGPYVRFIKKYIELNRKDHSVDEIRINLLKFGATPEEFDEALKQSNETPPVSKIPRPYPSLIKKTAIAGVTFVALILFIYTTFIYQKSSTGQNVVSPASDKTLNDIAKNSQHASGVPISQVYANVHQIDAS